MKIVFILAHFDDEAFSSGTIRKFVDDGHSVNILIVCGNGGSLHDDRKKIFIKNLELMGATGGSLGYFDLTLAGLDSSTKIELKESIETYIFDNKFDTVFTNNSGDIHTDHTTVSELVHVVCRPRSCEVKTLYECYIAGSTEYGKGTDDFKTIVDINPTILTKQQCVLNYNKHLKGAASYESIKYSSLYFGDMYGFNYAEIFKLVWDRSL